MLSCEYVTYQEALTFQICVVVTFLLRYLYKNICYLVGEYIGSTEERTSAKINEAKERVLFVDEAYRLTPRSEGVDYGRIAINQLMAAMEKGDLVMIFTGHPAEMKEFLKANPGLNSRIKYKFAFSDYSVKEMEQFL